MALLEKGSCVIILQRNIAGHSGDSSTCANSNRWKYGFGISSFCFNALVNAMLAVVDEKPGVHEYEQFHRRNFYPSARLAFQFLVESLSLALAITVTQQFTSNTERSFSISVPIRF
jgi:hypothetical protein